MQKEHGIRTSTGVEPFSLLKCLDANIFLLPSVFTLIEMICPKICSKSGLKSPKSPLPVHVSRSKRHQFRTFFALLDPTGFALIFNINVKDVRRNDHLSEKLKRMSLNLIRQLNYVTPPPVLRPISVNSLSSNKHRFSKALLRRQ